MLVFLKSKIISDIIEDGGVKEVARVLLFRVFNFYFWSSVDLFLVIQIAVFFGNH